MPWPLITASHVLRRPRVHTAFHQFRVPLSSDLPLLPEGASDTPSDPRVQVFEHRWGFAKTEISDPARHVPRQLVYGLLHAAPPAPQRDLSNSFFEPFQCLRRNSALRPLLAHVEAESQKLPLLRFRHRTLRLIYLEFQLVRDESLHALHHSLPRPFAAYVDIAIIRVRSERAGQRVMES